MNGGEAEKLPVLEFNGQQIAYGDKLASVKEKIPDIKQLDKSNPGYYMAFAKDKHVGLYVRNDTVVGWSTNVENSGVAGGIKTGDPYEKIFEIYPKVISGKELRALYAEEEAKSYDPAHDRHEDFYVYMDSKGNLYSHEEYNDKLTLFSDYEKWFLVSCRVFGEEIGLIEFADIKTAEGR